MLAAMLRGRRASGTLFVLVLLLAGSPFVSACRREEKTAGVAGGGAKPVELIFGAYTTPREVYGKAILPAFEKRWQEKTGQRVEFRESYQGSGAQARAIIGGFEADVAALSLEGDIDKIAQAGLITHDWKAKPHGGMVSDSIVVLAVRPGNPKKVLDWADLTRPGLNVLTPDPKTSGGAQWNINAMYGAALRGFAGVPKDDRNAAKEFLKRVFRNVSIMDKGARESMTTFEKGVGDVAVTYENEVLIGRQAGQSYDYVVPRSTILIENPVAVVDKSADKHGVRPIAEAFVSFLHEPEAQRLFARYGLRSVDEAVAKENASKLPPVPDLWKIDYLGGWKQVSGDLYGPDGVFTQVYSELGSRR
jgi:sulfate/thiosulfate transport system substrate-binding protein